MENRNIASKHAWYKCQVWALLQKRYWRTSFFIQLDINEADKGRRLHLGNTRFGGDSRVHFYLIFSSLLQRKNIKWPQAQNTTQILSLKSPMLHNTVFMHEEPLKALIHWFCSIRLLKSLGQEHITLKRVQTPVRLKISLNGQCQKGQEIVISKRNGN